MGMRSTIAYRDKNGNVKMTSVQWATQLDKNLSVALLDEKGNKEKDSARLGAIFKGITDKYDHVSSVEHFGDDPKNDPYERGDKISDGSEGDGNYRGLYASRGQERSKDPSEQYGVLKGASPARAKHATQEFHLDDGIGAFYDESKPGQIDFFYESRAGDGVRWESKTAAQLRRGDILEYHPEEQRRKFAEEAKQMNAERLERDKIKAAKARIAELETEKEKLLKSPAAGAASQSSESAPGGEVAPKQSTASSAGGASSSGGSVPRFHTNPETGKTGPCSATKQCRFGANTPHYTNRADAQKA